MIQRVIMPVLGETVERATIEKWRVKEGDPVQRGDILCDITTDKATLEVESFYTGTVLKLVARPGVELPVECLIAVVGEPGEKIPDDVLREAEAVASGAAPAKVATKGGATDMAIEEIEEIPTAPAAGRIFVSPRARTLAEREFVPLAVLRGSGPEGRVVEADVLAYLARLDELKVTPLARKVACERGVDVLALAAAGKKVTRHDVLAAPPAAAAAPAAQAAQPAVSGRRVPLSAMRRVIAERMSLSKREIPCYYLHMDVDVTDLVECRRRLSAAGDLKVSVNDYVILACARALGEFPDCNTRWAGDAIIYRDEINVGLAVALDQGLMVPVVRSADRKPLREIAAESRELAEKARTKRLVPSQYEGGCMTVSNLGMFGIKDFIPIVNPGESCILGLGVIEDRVVVRQGAMQIRKMMTMTLAADHRLIDGAVGAKFLERLRDLLEKPEDLEK